MTENVRCPRSGGEGMFYILALYCFCTGDSSRNMIKNAFKRTKKGLLVYLDDQMIEQFQDEDDFITDLQFDNQKGCFDLIVHY